MYHFRRIIGPLKIYIWVFFLNFYTQWRKIDFKYCTYLFFLPSHHCQCSKLFSIELLVLSYKYCLALSCYIICSKWMHTWNQSAENITKYVCTSTCIRTDKQCQLVYKTTLFSSFGVCNVFILSLLLKQLLYAITCTVDGVHLCIHWIKKLRHNIVLWKMTRLILLFIDSMTWIQFICYKKCYLKWKKNC